MSPRRGLDTQTILTASAELADALGYEEVSLASLAQKLQVRSPSLYNHLEGLGDLRKRMAIYGLELLYEAMSQAASGVSGDEAVHRIGRAYVDFVRRRPGLYEATLRAPDPKDPDIQLAAERILELVLEVLSVYRLGETDAIHMVRGLRSILHGFASLELKGGFGMDLDPDESLHLLLNTFIAGLPSS